MQSDRRETEKNPKIYISNLNAAFTEDDLRKQFEKYGTIESLSLKSKDTFSFAFIEYQNADQAEQAIDAMNRKSLDGKQIKVQFAKSRAAKEYNNRDRGGSRYGDRDRGSFRGRNDRDNGFRGRDDRGPRRDFGGDRPKGCFNCGKDGHFARDCSQPRKPREFNGGRGDRNDRGGDRSNYRRRSRSRSNDRQKKHRRRSSSGSSRS